MTNTREHSERLAILFRVYSQIIDYSTGIFSTLSPNTALLSCAHLLNTVSYNAPDGIDILRILLIFAELARSHECFQSARIAYDLIACDYDNCMLEEEKEKLIDDMMTIEVS